MESRTNYAIVGIIVILLTTALVLTCVWLSIGFDQKKYDLYAVYMKEAVSGLSADAPVKFNGVKVGYVERIRLNQKNPQQVELLLNIMHGTPITTSTSATLISQGITGTTYVGLAASSPTLTPLLKQKGAAYPEIPAKPSLFNQLDNALKGVSESINAVTVKVQEVFDEENAQNLKETLKNLRVFSKELATDQPHFHTMVVNLEKTIAQLPAITTEFGVGVRSFVRETIPEMNQTFNKMSRISTHLEKASSNIRNNPSSLIRGTAPPTPGPGE